MGKHYPGIHCKGCGEIPPIKSNLAINEELTRLSSYLEAKPEPGCQNEACKNHGAGVHSNPDRYQGFGKTRSGSARYRCKACRKTFSAGGSTLRQRKPHKNKEIFKLLMNKTPFRRICEISDIQPYTIYKKINFFHEQCLKLIGERERQLENMKFERLYLSSDRQDYIVNWTRRKDKRNVQMSAIGTADNASGYVFGMHLNFDTEMEQSQVEQETIKNSDYELPYPFRRHARLWTKGDYEESIKNAKAPKPRKAATSLIEEIEEVYEQALARDEIEKSDNRGGVRLPSKGMQTHLDYTAYGHYFLLKRLLAGAEKVRFFTDQDSALRAGILSAFCDEVKARKADAFYVRINKDMVTGEKRAAMERAEKLFEEARQEFPGLTTEEVKIEVVKAQFPRMQTIGRWNDRWMVHPLPTMGEPEKAVCYLTDLGDYDENHLARLYLKATLHPIDRFFMQVRNRLSVLARPSSTPSNARRIWYGNSAYNPEIVVKLLDIFRVYYNFTLPGKDKKTPAMRLGLAKGLVRVEDTLYH